MHSSTFAILAHNGLMYGNMPYEVHLAEVVGVLLKDIGVPADSPLVDAAWLHDVVEDTDTSIATVRSHFGGHVGDIVALVTDPELPTRAERKAEFHKRMSGISYDVRDFIRCDALVVKTADRVANLRTGLRDPHTNIGKIQKYVKEDEAFRKLYTPGFLRSPYSEKAYELYVSTMVGFEFYMATS
jgi:(p)ppGpp synthase/HD superfamily hydrolase